MPMKGAVKHAKAKSLPSVDTSVPILTGTGQHLSDGVDEGFLSDEYYDSDGSEDVDEAEEDTGEDSGDEDDESGDDSEDGDSDDEFEQQSSDDGSIVEEDDDSSVDDDARQDNVEARQILQEAESSARTWSVGRARAREIEKAKTQGLMALPNLMNTDDLSSDDEEAEGNTIGRVPLHWYDAFDHIGYDVHGEKVLKRKGKDRLDQAIANADSAGGRTVYDMYNDREVVLSERDIEIIRRIQAGAFAHPEHDDTPDYVDYFSSQKEIMPLSGRMEPKHKFLPSKWEMLKVKKIVKAMREGRYQTIKEREDEKRGVGKAPVYMIWNDGEDEILAESKRNKYHLPAPKMPLPGHAESYNPPAEYLLTEEEQKQIEAMDPSDRPYNFIPKQHACLRHVSGYKDFVKERFERCLDLYMCPRKLKLRLNIDPETLVPRLPKPQELRPYPNSLVLQYLGHKKAVRSIAVSPDGQYLVSGSDDGTVRLWEVDTCLCRYVWSLGPSPVLCVAWNPHSAHHVVAAAVGKKVVFISTGTGDEDSSEVTETLLAQAEQAAAAAGSAEGLGGAAAGGDSDNDGDGKEEDDDEEGGSGDAGKKRIGKRLVVATWHSFSEADSSAATDSTKASEVSALRKAQKASPVPAAVTMRHGVAVGPRIELRFTEAVSLVTWHYKGDYVATLAPDAGTKAVAIHQLSKGKTQTPFVKSPGRVQSVSFHPSRPYIFVVTQQHIKIFHLIEQTLVKKLLSGCKWLSSVDVHASGDHVIVGSYDRRVVWFDLDLSSTPFKTLKFHEKAVRCVQLHKRYPLMASASDDGTVHIFHSTVYSDLTRNPLIVPLKILRGHGVKGGLGVLSIAFHPRQPWVFSAGVDGVINLFQDL